MDISKELDISFSEFPIGPVNVGDNIPCKIAGTSIHFIEYIPLGEGKAEFVLLYIVYIELNDPHDPSIVIYKKISFIYRTTLCWPLGTTLGLWINSNFCHSIVSSINSESFLVSATIQLCLEFKSMYEVNLLVPSYGFFTLYPCIKL